MAGSSGVATISLSFSQDGCLKEHSDILVKCDRDVFRNLLEHTVAQVARDHGGF